MLNKLNKNALKKFEEHLIEIERSKNTIEKYVRDIKVFFDFMEKRSVNKENVLEYKNHLISNYAPASVNSMLAALNSFLKFFDRQDCCVKTLKIQKQLFIPENKELYFEEYQKLIKTAEERGCRRLSLIAQTICSTGIRVSELQYITVKAVKNGRAIISSKGKYRVVFLPLQLCLLLKKYIKSKKITAGAVFVTRNGNPVDRSHIWQDLKKLCKAAGVNPEKVFPHNLRHLFARTFYSVKKDLSRLADILGHSNISTTRIYTIESGKVHAQQINSLNLVISAP